MLAHDAGSPGHISTFFITHCDFLSVRSSLLKKEKSLQSTTSEKNSNNSNDNYKLLDKIYAHHLMKHFAKDCM